MIKKICYTCLTLLSVLIVVLGCTKVNIQSNNKKISNTYISLKDVQNVTSKYKSSLEQGTFLHKEDVTKGLIKGIVSYPNDDDNNVKVVYYLYKENGLTYYLDTFYVDNYLIRVETRLEEYPKQFTNSMIQDYDSIQDEINQASNYSELQEIIGNGTEIIHYYKDQVKVVGWSLIGNKFLIAQVTEDGQIISSLVVDQIDEVIKPTATCH